MRKVKFNLILFLLFATLFVLNFSIENSVSAESIEEENFAIPKLNALTVHDAIEISSDADPDLAGLSGDGSSGNPYLIENYYISVTNNTAISIHDTTHFYSILNCYVSGDQYGISIYNRVNGNTNIKDCIIEDNFYCGIYVNDESSTHIENNTIHNNWGFGIYINAAGGGITITNNRLTNNNNNAIYVYNTDGVEISFNECWNNINKDNIYLYLSDHSVVASNTVYDGKDVEGIYIDTCQSPDVFDNICFNLSYGIDLYESPDAIVTTNEVYETVYYGITALRLYL